MSQDIDNSEYAKKLRVQGYEAGYKVGIESGKTQASAEGTNMRTERPEVPTSGTLEASTTFEQLIDEVLPKVGNKYNGSCHISEVMEEAEAKQRLLDYVETKLEKRYDYGYRVGYRTATLKAKEEVDQLVAAGRIDELEHILFTDDAYQFSKWLTDRIATLKKEVSNG